METRACLVVASGQVTQSKQDFCPVLFVGFLLFFFLFLSCFETGSHCVVLELLSLLNSWNYRSMSQWFALLDFSESKFILGVVASAHSTWEVEAGRAL